MFNIRMIGWAALGVVAGFLLGGLGPKMEKQQLLTEISARDAEIETLSARKGGARGGSAFPVPGMQEMFAQPRKRPKAEEKPPKSDADDDDEANIEITIGNDEEEKEEEAAGDTGTAPSNDQMSTEAMIEQYDMAVTAQTVRAEQSRAALTEQADLDEESVQQVDQIMMDMNDSLAMYGEDLMYIALSEGQPAAEDMLGLTHEVTGVLYEAQQQLNDLIGPDAEVDDEARQVWNYLDLEVFRGTVEQMAAEGITP